VQLDDGLETFREDENLAFGDLDPFHSVLRNEILKGSRPVDVLYHLQVVVGIMVAIKRESRHNYLNLVRVHLYLIFPEGLLDVIEL